MRKASATPARFRGNRHCQRRRTKVMRQFREDHPQLVCPTGVDRQSPQSPASLPVPDVSRMPHATFFCVIGIIVYDRSVKAWGIRKLRGNDINRSNSVSDPRLKIHPAHTETSPLSTSLSPASANGPGAGCSDIGNEPGARERFQVIEGKAATAGKTIGFDRAANLTWQPGGRRGGALLVMPVS